MPMSSTLTRPTRRPTLIRPARGPTRGPTRACAELTCAASGRAGTTYRPPSWDMRACSQWRAPVPPTHGGHHDAVDRDPSGLVRAAATGQSRGGDGAVEHHVRRAVGAGPALRRGAARARRRPGRPGGLDAAERAGPVSYTHLTLPTIYS